MRASLPSRRLAELKAKLQSLDTELEHWSALTAAPGNGLGRHQSQVLRLKTVFDKLTEPVRAVTADLQSDVAILDRVETWENQILAAHSIWEVFRSKLVLREDELFRDVLAACDDLLWACYGPAMQRFGPDSKGPPLVYFTSTWSPFAMSRDSSFQNEIRRSPGMSGAITGEPYLQVLRRLPIPLVSLPWYHAFHLPGALILGHEAGHIVEWDFGLTSEMESALERAALDHPEIWKRWLSEVFADLWGCLMLGPAFAGAMMDMLSGSVRAVQLEDSSAGRYPTRALRVELMLAALTECGHTREVQRLRSEWEGTYGAMAAMAGFKDDVQRVVSALLQGPYSGASLMDIGRFPSNKNDDVPEIGRAAAEGYAEVLKLYEDPRLLFAGAEWLHRNPLPGDSRKAYALLVKQAITQGGNEVRNTGEQGAQEDFEAAKARWRDADERTGLELGHLLEQMGAVSSSGNPGSD